jgi:hypothetical protein
VIGISGIGNVERGSLEPDITMGKNRWLQDKEIATALDVGSISG